MESVGIRELKAHLSRHLKRVEAGGRLLVTDRGRVIAAIGPAGPGGAAEEGPEVEWARRMVVEGRVQWAGGKPHGARRRIATTGGPTLAETVLEDRR
jgi:prevent-host-death family protein